MVRALKVHRNVNIVVVGDPKSGKSSLISTLVLESFPTNPASVLPAFHIPGSITPDLVNIKIIDTSSKINDWGVTGEAVQDSDVVIICYDTSNPKQFERIPVLVGEIRRFQEQSTRYLPVILCGTKIDLRGTNMENQNFYSSMKELMSQFPEIETGLECSAKKLLNVNEIFYFAQKAVLYPANPLYDPIKKQLKPEAAVAFARLFSLLDQDGDGILDDQEIAYFQQLCFGIPLYDNEVNEIKRTIQRRFPEGATEDGINLVGFLFILRLFILKGKLESPWTILRKFKYTNELRLQEEYLYPPFDYSPIQDQVELTDIGEEFFTSVFRRHFTKGTEDDSMTIPQLEKLFLTLTPEIPWKFPLLGVETNKKGNLTLTGWLCQWKLTTFEDPKKTLRYMAYLGYEKEPEMALVPKPKNAALHRKTVFRWLLFGPTELTDPLCKTLLNRDLNDLSPIPEKICQMVYPDGYPKTILLTPMYFNQNTKIKANQLPDCDVMCFAYDGEDTESFKPVVDLHEKAMPLLVSSKTASVHIPCFFNTFTPVRQNCHLQPAEFLEKYKTVMQKYYVHGTTTQSIFEDILNQLNIEIPSVYKFFRSWIRIWPLRWIAPDHSSFMFSFLQLWFGTLILHGLNYSVLGWPLFSPLIPVKWFLNIISGNVGGWTSTVVYFLTKPFRVWPHYPWELMEDLLAWSTGHHAPHRSQIEGTIYDYFGEGSSINMLMNRPESFLTMELEDVFPQTIPDDYLITPQMEYELGAYPFQSTFSYPPWSGKGHLNPQVQEALQNVSLDTVVNDSRVYGKPLDEHDQFPDPDIEPFQLFTTFPQGPNRGQVAYGENTTRGNSRRTISNI